MILHRHHHHEPHNLSIVSKVDDVPLHVLHRMLAKTTTMMMRMMMQDGCFVLQVLTNSMRMVLIRTSVNMICIELMMTMMVAMLVYQCVVLVMMLMTAMMMITMS